MPRRLACVVVALLVSACGLPFLNSAPEYGFIVVTDDGSLLEPGSNNVPPTLDLRMHGGVAFRLEDVTATLDNQSLTLALSGGDVVSHTAPLPLGSPHHLDVTIAGRAQGISIDFNVISPTAAMLAAHVDPSAGLVVDGAFADAPDQAKLAAALPGAAVSWVDSTHMRASWHGSPPAAVDLPASIPTARGSHLAALIHLRLTGIPSGSLRRVTVPAPPAVKGVNVVAFVIDTGASNTSFAAHRGALSWVAPTGWVAQPDGSVLGTPDPSTVARAQGANLPVWPSLENDPSDPGGTSMLLNTPSAVSSLVGTIVQAVTADGFAGVNLDFEGMAGTDKDSFTAFVHTLASALHMHSAKLAVDVVPHGSGGPNQFSAAYDVPAIGSAADVVDVMAYDEHGEGGDPGPVAGLDWDVAELAATLVGLNPAHTLLGVPLYARSWTNGVGESLTYPEAISRLQNAGARVTYDFDAQTPYIVSADGSTVTYFDDADSLARKIALVSQDHLAGIAAWRLGFEDPAFWSLFG
jgi:spore germination protein YaaH